MITIINVESGGDMICFISFFRFSFPISLINPLIVLLDVCVVLALNQRPSLPFRGMYSPGMEDTKKSLAVFAILAEVKVPKLWIHMQNQGIHHSMFVTSWIMTVFVSSFHFDFAVRVWDILWVEGWKTVYRVCIGLLKYAEAELLTCNMEDIMMYFRKLPDRMNPEEVWKVVWKVKLSQAEVTRCEQWYYEESGAA